MSARPTIAETRQKILDEFTRADKVAQRLGFRIDPPTQDRIERLLMEVIGDGRSYESIYEGLYTYLQNRVIGVLEEGKPDRIVDGPL